MSLDVQVTLEVRSWLDPSENVASAVNCCAVPVAMLAVVGVTVSPISVAGLTTAVVMAVWPSKLAQTWVLPPARAESKPLLLMVATVGTDDCHMVWFVTFCVDPSEYSPVAVNCSVEPAPSEAAIGLIVRDCSVGEVGGGFVEAAVTVRVALAPIPPAVTWMVTSPCAMAEASPVLLTVATAGLEDTHVAPADRFWVEPSE